MILSLAQDCNGSLWIGTVTGTVPAGQGARHPIPIAGLEHSVIMSLLVSRDGSLWVGSIDQGLMRLQGGKWRHFTALDGLPDDFVASMYEDAEGTLWLGTNGGGLCRYRAGRFAVVTAQQGLFDDTILQILEDNQGNLWMSSNHGVFRVDKRRLNEVADHQISSVDSFRYGKADGMKSAECTGNNQPAGWKTQDGRLWFPTIKGVAIVDPSSLAKQHQTAASGDRRIDCGQEVHCAGKRDLASTRNAQVELHFTGLSFVAPGRVRFKYMLEGFDSGWIDAGTRRIAYYTNLSPGSYRFRVIACNNSGVWNEDGVPRHSRYSRISIRPVFLYRLWIVDGTRRAALYRKPDRRESGANSEDWPFWWTRAPRS